MNEVSILRLSSVLINISAGDLISAICLDLVEDIMEPENNLLRAVL